MSNPFQDQFLKAGLTDKKKVKQAQKSQKNLTKKKHKGHAVPVDENKKRVEKAAKEKSEKDRALNQAKVQKAQQKAISAQIKQLIEMNAIEPTDDSITFRFEADKKIKEIQLDQDTQKKLVAGTFCIARLAANYSIIPKPVADKITQRDASYIILANTLSEQSQADDEYKDFQVPDDLMW